MIARIRGRIIEKRQNSLLIDTAGLAYEVFVPVNSLQRAQETSADGNIELITYHYHQVEPSRSVPVLIGFLNEIEKEFFQSFITVSGIGPRAALKALNQPISLIAKAIDEGNISFLRSLPGIGQQRAKEIVAKLQNKVGKFGLMQDSPAPAGAPGENYRDEALAVLEQLGYRKAEAEQMIRNAVQNNPDVCSTEDLLNEVYKQKRLT